jgi:hypothetical protein
MRNLNTHAEELEALLAGPQVDTTAPHIDESYMIAARATNPINVVRSSFARWPGQEDEDDKKFEEERYTHLPELVKVIVDYALNKAPASATAEDVGKAIGVGVTEAAHQLKLDDLRVRNAVAKFLHDLTGAVHNSLSME